MARDLEAGRRALNRRYIAGEIDAADLARQVHALRKDCPDAELDAMVGFDAHDPEMPLLADGVSYALATRERDRLNDERDIYDECEQPRPGRLSRKQEREVVRMHRDGMSEHKLAALFGVSRRQISNAIEKERVSKARIGGRAGRTDRGGGPAAA